MRYMQVAAPKPRGAFGDVAGPDGLPDHYQASAAYRNGDAVDWESSAASVIFPHGMPRPAVNGARLDGMIAVSANPNFDMTTAVEASSQLQQRIAADKRKRDDVEAAAGGSRKGGAKRLKDEGHVQQLVKLSNMNGGTKSRRSSKTWSSEEDSKLRDAVERLGTANWFEVAKRVGTNRPQTQYSYRWTKVLNPGLVKGSWTEDEDNLIRREVQEKGINEVRWSAVAEKLVGRIGKQCRERWYNHLDPSITRSAWTEEEDRIIFESQSRIGNKWTDIAKLLPGRSENAVKNRYHSRARRQWENKQKINGGFNRDAKARQTTQGEIERLQARLVRRRMVATVASLAALGVLEHIRATEADGDGDQTATSNESEDDFEAFQNSADIDNDQPASSMTFEAGAAFMTNDASSTIGGESVDAAPGGDQPAMESPAGSAEPSPAKEKPAKRSSLRSWIGRICQRAKRAIENGGLGEVAEIALDGLHADDATVEELRAAIDGDVAISNEERVLTSSAIECAVKELATYPWDAAEEMARENGLEGSFLSTVSGSRASNLDEAQRTTSEKAGQGQLSSTASLTLSGSTGALLQVVLGDDNSGSSGVALSDSIEASLARGSGSLPTPLSVAAGDTQSSTFTLNGGLHDEDEADQQASERPAPKLSAIHCGRATRGRNGSSSGLLGDPRLRDTSPTARAFSSLRQILHLDQRLRCVKKVRRERTTSRPSIPLMQPIVDSLFAGQTRREIGEARHRHRCLP
eukprot:scaffold7676_cov258-Pinguiococcus_pyrenoidosus.AAC.1